MIRSMDESIVWNEEKERSLLLLMFHMGYESERDEITVESNKASMKTYEDIFFDDGRVSSVYDVVELLYGKENPKKKRIFKALDDMQASGRIAAHAAMGSSAEVEAASMDALKECTASWR